jgi:hypothetical protein
MKLLLIFHYPHAPVTFCLLVSDIYLRIFSQFSHFSQFKLSPRDESNFTAIQNSR